MPRAVTPTNATGPSSTGCRPACSTERTACASAAADAAADGPGTTSATGCPHMPRITGANVAAVDASVTRTLADGPMAAHSAAAAATEPAYVADAPTPRSRTRLTNRDTLDERAEDEADEDAAGACDRPGFSVVMSGGPASASTQQAPTTATAAREAPKAQARDSSHDDTHTPNSTSPGSTTGTSRWDAMGCHGTTDGSHSTVTTDQATISNGSPHSHTTEVGTAARGGAGGDGRGRERPRGGRGIEIRIEIGTGTGRR